MHQQEIQQAAQRMLHARRTHTKTALLGEEYPHCTVEDGYAIQRQTRQLLEQDGERIVGRKVGFSMNEARQRLGLSEPAHGYIPAGRVHLDGAVGELDCGQILVEPELVFFFGQDLNMQQISPADILCAITGFAAGLELVWSCLDSEELHLPSTVAENMSFEGAVMGQSIVPLTGVDLSALGVSVYKNGRLIGTASSGAVMGGSPLNSLVWLANKLVSQGDCIRAGDMVLSGTFLSPFTLEPGESCEARFDRAGSVRFALA